MAEWIEVQDGRNLTRITMIRGYAITITGSNDFWSWFIDLKGRYVTEGTACDLTTAAAAAEDEPAVFMLGRVDAVSDGVR